MRIEKLEITPIMAVDFLKRNPNNRKINTKIVHRYAADIKNGKWKEDTGELIKISEDGNLIDGQHRLSAIVEAGVSVYLHVAFNVSSTVFDVLDTGKKRSASDVFEIKNISYSTQLPSIISTFIRLESSSYQAKQGLTNQEIYQEYAKRPNYWDGIATYTQSMYMSFAKVLPPSLIGGVFAHLDKVENKGAQNEFIEQLCTGAFIKNKTMFTVRNVLISDKMKTKNKFTTKDKVALIIRAWNAFVKGIKLKRLLLNKTKFPTAIICKVEK